MSIFSKFLGRITDKQVLAITNSNDPHLGNPFATMRDIGGTGYKVYVALLTQASTGAPTAKVLANTLGGDIAWTYSDAGQYIGTLSGAFPANKLWYSASMGQFGTYTDAIVDVQIGRTNDNSIYLGAILSGTGFSNDVLTDTPIEIRIYN